MTSGQAGVGVECQGFAQKENKQAKRIGELLKAKQCPDSSLPDCNGTNGTPGTDCC